MNRLTILMTAVLLAWCSEPNTTDPYLQGTRCKAGHESSFTTFMAVSCGNGCIVNVPIVQTICSEHEIYTYANPNYKATP